MPALAENVSMWNDTYDWSQRGDEWSAAWGGVSYQWWVTLFSRIQGFVPAARILEIAPGYGRWTNYLRDLCDELIAVDIAETAIAHCRQRFAADTHVTFHVNDGTSLAIADDRSVDLVFSFDSLVHAESDIIIGYLQEFARVLAQDGVAFIHHSNMAAHEPGSYDPNNIHWRATSVSAELVERHARQVGLSCISQEMVGWGTDTIANDCFSVITRAGSVWDRENKILINTDFSRHELSAAKNIAALYPAANPALAFKAQERQPVAVHHADASDLTQSGDVAAARALLLDALVRLYPERSAVQTNLAALREAA